MQLLSRGIFAQTLPYHTDVDTLKSFDNFILANCKTFMNENLTEESIAYLYPVTIKMPRFKLTGNLLLKKIEMDSIVRHGFVKKYFENKLIQLSEYENGKEVYVIYYDQNGKEISKEEYTKMYNLNQPCDKIIGIYLIRGKKKKKGA